MIKRENTKIINDRDFWIEQYVRLGKSTSVIAKEFGFARQTIIQKLRKLKLIRSPSESKKSEKNPMWKGDKVGYTPLHRWIKDNKPKQEFCENCKKDKPYDLANISGEYKRDINDFKWLCRRCHMKEDGRINNLIKRNERR